MRRVDACVLGAAHSPAQRSGPSVARAAVPFVLAICLAPPLHAQVSESADCTYAACALRVKHSFFGTSLVRGEEDVRVQGLNWWVGATDAAFEGVPVAQELAATFRRRHNAGFVVLVAGLGGFYAAVYTDPGDSSGLALGLVGLTVGLAGAITMQSGSDYLSRAVWVYNETLPRDR